MIPGIDEDFDRVCRQVAAVIVSTLVVFTLGMWVMRGVALPQFFLASGVCVVVLVVDAFLARGRSRRSAA